MKISDCSVFFNPSEGLRFPYGLYNPVSVFNVSGEVLNPWIEYVLEAVFPQV